MGRRVPLGRRLRRRDLVERDVAPVALDRTTRGHAQDDQRRRDALRGPSAHTNARRRDRDTHDDAAEQRRERVLHGRVDGKERDVHDRRDTVQRGGLDDDRDGRGVVEVAARAGRAAQRTAVVEQPARDERGREDVRRDGERPEGRAEVDHRREAEDRAGLGGLDEQADACGCGCALALRRPRAVGGSLTNRCEIEYDGPEEEDIQTPDDVCAVELEARSAN